MHNAQQNWIRFKKARAVRKEPKDVWLERPLPDTASAVCVELLNLAPDPFSCYRLLQVSFLLFPSTLPGLLQFAPVSLSLLLFLPTPPDLHLVPSTQNHF